MAAVIGRRNLVINFLMVASIVIIINITRLTIHTVLSLSGIKIKSEFKLATVCFLRSILLFHEFPGSILKVAEINLYLLGIYDDKLQM